MSKLIAAARNFVRNEEGATAVEYALMVALIAVVIIVSVRALGEKANDTFDQVEKAMPAGGGGGGN